MTDQPRDEDLRPEMEQRANAANNQPTATNRPDDSTADASTGAQSSTAKSLTPDEQMALFEKDLKENDWGHQPC